MLADLKLDPAQAIRLFHPANNKRRSGSSLSPHLSTLNFLLIPLRS